MYGVVKNNIIIIFYRHDNLDGRVPVGFEADFFYITPYADDGVVVIGNQFMGAINILGTGPVTVDSV